MIKRILILLIYIIGGIEISILAPPIALYTMIYWIVTGKDNFTNTMTFFVSWVENLETKLNKNDEKNEEYTFIS